MKVQQISIFMENKPGIFRQIASLFGEHHINMRAMSVAETADFGILRIIVDDPETAQKVLQEAGYIFNLTPVLAVAVDDRPGSLTRILSLLEQAEISLEYMYAFITRKENGAYLVFRVDDPDKTAALLIKEGIELVAQNEIAGL